MVRFHHKIQNERKGDEENEEKNETYGTATGGSNNLQQRIGICIYCEQQRKPNINNNTIAYLI